MITGDSVPWLLLHAINTLKIFCVGYALSKCMVRSAPVLGKGLVTVNGKCLGPKAYLA